MESVAFMRNPNEVNGQNVLTGLAAALQMTKVSLNYVSLSMLVLSINYQRVYVNKSMQTPLQ